MTTFGNRVAAACDDGTVCIYATATGVLKLSLSPLDPVQAICGSPDGSMLFCAHRKLSITVWDLQTGGLIRTLVFKGEAEDVAISLQGRYLACGLSNGSVKTWELASMEEGGSIGRGGGPVACLCWLQPEQHLVVAKGRWMELLDVFPGKLLFKFAMEGPIRSLGSSRGFGTLIVVTSGFSQISTLAVNSLPWRDISEFKDIATTTTNGLEQLGFDRPGRIMSVSMLSDGIVVANVAGLGIQLLNLDEEHAPSRQSNIPTLTVRTLDHGNIIATLPTTRDHIALLETATMSKLHKIPACDSPAPTQRSVVLCASLKNGMAFHYFGEGGRKFLQLWKFRRGKPEWTMEINQWLLVGGISPAGAHLVTFGITDRPQIFGYTNQPQTLGFTDERQDESICVWDARNGQLQAQISVIESWDTHPLEIKFESEDQFFSQHDTHRIPYVISSSLKAGTPSPSIIRNGEVPSVERRYNVDDTREWIVYSSKKVCWIPLGYINPIEHSYCWAGRSLVMVGEDHVLRKLTLENDFERWGLHAD